MSTLQQSPQYIKEFLFLCFLILFCLKARQDKHQTIIVLFCLLDQERAYFKKIEDMNLRNPLMVGFGISNKATFQAACEHASGAIIGSRFVTLLEEEKDPEKAILKLKEALR